MIKEEVSMNFNDFFFPFNLVPPQLHSKKESEFVVNDVFDK